MGKDPAILFYPSDFLGGVALMSMKERGQYITLLCFQRERGHMTEKEMRKVIGGTLSEELRSKFVADEDGKLYNVRMEKEILKRKAYSQKQSENVKKRWEKKNASTDAVGMNGGNTVVHTTVLPLGNRNGNGDGNRNFSREIEKKAAGTGKMEDRGSGGKEDEGFERFWAAYPKPSGDICRAYMEYLRALDSGATLETLLSALEWQRCQPGWTEREGQFIPSPERWLRNRAWLRKKPERPPGPEPETDEKKLERMRRMYAQMTGEKHENEEKN